MVDMPGKFDVGTITRVSNDLGGFPEWVEAL